MEMESDDESLRSLAAGDSMDYSTWPLLLSTIISRLDRISRNDFPIPRIPEPASPVALSPHEPRFLAPLPSSDVLEPPQSSAPNDGTSSADSSQETDKENAAPTPPTSAPAPTPVSAPVAVATSAPEPGTLPPQIVAMIAEINGVLNESFHTYPPHTIQRLAELILRPRQHYRSLPSYLHAVDRVVHVTSGNNIYPLPPAIPDMSTMSLGGPNGVMDQGQQQENGSDTSMAWVSTSNGDVIGSDEALGGALLTPIPWLQRRSSGNRDGDGGSESGESSTLGSDGGPSPMASGQGGPASSQRSSSQQSSRQFETRTESTETIDGPNGVGRIETVSISVNGIPPMGSAAQQRVITQGELIRQEQRAGVVPVSQLQRSGPVVVTSSEAATNGDGPPDAADNDTAMGEGEGEQLRDTGSEKSDEEMPDEEEAPHARGPDLIGAADMGPQGPTSSSFSLSSGGTMEVRGIDVEAAVGRRHEAPATAATAAAAAATDEAPDWSDDSAAIMTPPSSEEGDAAKKGGEAKTAEQAADKEKDKDVEKAADYSSEMDTTPSSATLSARVSPTPSSKRGAEDDEDAEAAGSSHKRLKEDAGGESEVKGSPSAGETETSPADKDGAQDDASKDDDAGATEKKEGEGDHESESKDKAEEQEDSTTDAGEDSAS